MITWHSTIPPWRKDNPNRTSDTYREILENFARCCNDDDVIFYDNTYASLDEMIEAIKDHKKAIIFNMLDPPCTWHYLERCMQGLDTQVIFVGTDAPDISTWFWPAWAHREWPKYTAEELMFQPNDEQLVFLSYNYGPHEHRKRLKSILESRDLLSSGHFTFFDLDRLRNPPGRETNLGDLNIWRRCFLNVVSETVFSLHPEFIVSEKTLKPILGLRPFIINGSPRCYDILESWDIDLFSDILPIAKMREPIGDLNQCMDRNINLIGDTIGQLSNNQLQNLYRDLLPRLQSNQIKMQRLMANEYKRLCIDDIEFRWRNL